MKSAQTTLSRRDSLKIARRFNAGNGLACASSPAGARLANESQRDSGPKPKVARHELPWVNVVQNFFNPNGVAASRRPTVTQPRWGCWDLSRLTQGSSSLTTLGWWTQSRWDCPQTISDVAVAGASHTAALRTQAARN